MAFLRLAVRPAGAFTDDIENGVVEIRRSVLRAPILTVHLADIFTLPR